MFDALILRARGNPDAAISILSKAEAVVDSAPPVGPVALLPVHELVAAMLFDAGRYTDAAAAYTRALAYAPNRSTALVGLALSQHRAKNFAASDTTYARLRANWSHADPPVRAQVPKSSARSP